MSSDPAGLSSSSAPDHAASSDDLQHASSPPSSPPDFPWERVSAATSSSQAASPSKSSQPTNRSAFSILGKRKPLESIDDNIRPSKKSSLTDLNDRRKRHSSVSSEPKQLTQLQISLGQQVRKTCIQCGMEYVTSSEDDRKLHAKYHSDWAEGCYLGRDFVAQTPEENRWPGVKGGDTICLVNSFDRPARKRKAQMVFEMVQKELGAVDIPEGEMWSDKLVVKGESVSKRSFPTKYTAFLYVRGTRCIGFLLTKRISSARKVLEPRDKAGGPRASPAIGGNSSALAALQARRRVSEEQLREAENQPIRLSDDETPAGFGVSRIWTLSSCRGQHVASAMLDEALRRDVDLPEETTEVRDLKDLDPIERKIYKMGVGLKEAETARRKQLVAFSQPTECGARLARRWLGRTYGWLVYVD